MRSLVDRCAVVGFASAGYLERELASSGSGFPTARFSRMDERDDGR
jgi:hypothetical protein